MTPRETVSNYFAAMRRGPEAEVELLALFAPDAVYSEPFIVPGTPAVGREAIGERLREGWREPLPDMTLDVLSVKVDGMTATSTWECRSSAFPRPARGTDRYWFEDGLITRLEVNLEQGLGNDADVEPANRADDNGDGGS